MAADEKSYILDRRNYSEDRVSRIKIYLINKYLFFDDRQASSIDSTENAFDDMKQLINVSILRSFHIY